MSEQRKYVIHIHHRQDEKAHWDLMLESSAGLETYRLDAPPEQIIRNSQNKAVKIFTHDKKFLTYQGPVNNNTGSVEITDCGTFEQLDNSEQNSLLQFQGLILKGTFQISHIKDDIYSLSPVPDQAKPFVSL